MEPYKVTDDQAFERELDVNRQAYATMQDELRSKYAGRYVAIAHGRLAAVADTFAEADALVQQLQPLPQHYVVFEGDGDPMFEPYYSDHWEYL
jgi:hypothetical protein